MVYRFCRFFGEGWIIPGFFGLLLPILNPPFLKDEGRGTAAKFQYGADGLGKGRMSGVSETERREKVNIESALKQPDWKIYGAGGAAELLSLKPTTLLSRIKKMGIEKSY